MTDYLDLELGLHRHDAEQYTIEMRYTDPASEATTHPLRAVPTVQFDHAALQAAANNPQTYGAALGAALFPDEVATAMREVLSAAQAQNRPLRLRLAIGPTAPNLHALRWETLLLPADDTPLATSERVIFSRYLGSTDWRPVKLRARRDLRALVVIANPNDLESYQPGGVSLAPVDVAGERERALASLGNDVTTTVLDSNGQSTLETLITHLRDDYDLLYLVAHGAIIDGGPYLWLEDEQGNAAIVAGPDLVQRMNSLPQHPRLVVLASCQSAGDGTDQQSQDGGALAALGPRLAAAGVPAVLAMQANVSMQTVADFMPVFFQELQRDGQIDRAMTTARGAVQQRYDWWVPVLLTRLKRGRLWYDAGFDIGERGRAEEKWEPLIASILDEECTPILGPDLGEWLFGSRRDLALHLADDFHFPLAPHDRDDLPQVAQYLAVVKALNFLPRTLMRYRCEAIRTHNPGDPSDTDDATLDKASRKKLLALLETLTEQVWQQHPDPTEPHRLLAGMPFPIYITTDPGNLLTMALQQAGKAPQVVLCPWNDAARKVRSIYDEEPDFEPDEDRPLVYHLFGTFEEPDTLVLTEDHYFDYLIGVTHNKDLLPLCVRQMLTDSALLLVGFRMDDWAFRVLFRTLMNQQGSTRRGHYAHVAAQVMPEEDRILEPQRAQHFLEEYFEGADMSVYWGSVADFMHDLSEQWEGAN